MDDFEILPWLIAATIFIVVPFWRIFARAGFKPAFSLLALIPGGILILLWVMAFAKWPAYTETKEKTE